MGLDLLKKRHSLAHILAQAVQREQQRNVEVGIGPAIDNGFYYDFLFDSKNQIKEEDLTKIQNQMEKIVKEGQEFIVLEMTDAQSKELVTKIMKQKYKEEMRAEFVQDGESITFYVNTIVAAAKDNLLKGVDENYIKYYQEITDYLQKKYPGKFENKFVTFLDMCEGPHVESTKEIDPKSFKLEKLAGAYWRGDENNVMMTRIYARAFDSKDKLREYSDMMEEAKKRDHRVLGKKLGLYNIDQDVGSGLVLRKPKGAFIVNQIKRWFEDEQLKAGYVPVITPHIGKKKLREQSGHRGFYNEGMFPPLELGCSLGERQDNRKPKESEIYLLKPMNCPAHVKVYKDDIHSYRELPLRYYEFGTVYRYEKQGELGGLTRVRGFTQDDAHIIVSKDGLKEEFGKVVDFAFKVLHHFDFQDIKVFASFSDPNSDKYVGDKAMRKQAEDTIREILKEKQIEHEEELGEAAFYGPKIDFKVKDVIGRYRQLSTVQFDFNLPERFDMTFTNPQGEQERPFMIHRALLGSLERFMGVLIENYAGAFPMWLAPEQIRIIAVADKFENYAQKVKEELVSKGYRVTVDYSSDSFSKKIRNGEIEKIPYLFIVGEKEESENTISWRSYKTKEQGTCTLEEFVQLQACLPAKAGL
ncbi:MAG TPA: threonine--tRNA ligase [Candidatus Absconditabacterales bacterium]|nr:threonine--tRNA ligase [Candidatus Absconditabacterales bacterium]